MSLPAGWSEGVSADGKVYYSHGTIGTTWSRPPASLPEGWTMALDQVRLVIVSG